MSEKVEQMIVRNLIDALECLREDLDRVELWTTALGCFQQPVPGYQDGDPYLLPTEDRPAPRVRL